MISRRLAASGGHIFLLTAEVDVDRNQFAVDEKPFTSCRPERRANFPEALQHPMVRVCKCLSAVQAGFEIEWITFWNPRNSLGVANRDEIGARGRRVREIELAVEFLGALLRREPSPQDSFRRECGVPRPMGAAQR